MWAQTTINEEMKRAAVYAIADLALEEQNEVVTSAYGGEGADIWCGLCDSSSI